MAAPSKTALQVYRGDAVGLRVTLWQDAEKTQPADLTGADVNAQIRASADSAEVIADFDVAVETNVVMLHLFPKQSAVLPALSVFDLEVVWDGVGGEQVQTVLVGSITTTADVTRVG